MDLPPADSAKKRARVLRAFAASSARPLPWLLLAAAVPFLPGACQFLQRGIPDVLFTGDGGTLELRVLHAAHGTQLLGPYSRFQWSHPGPAFFYLALPFYELFHEHGPALNLFAFVANFASVVALVLSARRLRGVVFALSAAALLAIDECVNPQFQLSGEWNPVTPVLPLALLAFLGARLGLGNVGVLPAFAFVASAIVQTHLGFVPVVLAVSLVAGACAFARTITAPALEARRSLAGSEAAAAAQRRVRALVSTGFVLALMWCLPVIENAMKGPRGNLRLLFEFFTAPHAPEHTWRIVWETVTPKLAFLPLMAAELAGLTIAPTFALTQGIVIVEIVALVAALATGLRRRDGTVAVLASIALGEIAASVTAVRGIRGEIHPYLLVWITIVGWFAVTAIVAWILSIAPRALKRRAVSAALGIAAAIVFGLCLREQARRTNVFRSPDQDAERLAHDVEQYLVSAHVRGPLVRIATADEWPTAVAVILDLFKHHVPFFVDRYWLFMMGTEFAAPSLERPWLHIGDRAFYESVEKRPDFRLVATTGEACAFLSDPDYLRTHRRAAPPRLVSATGVVGDAARAVDGVVPEDGTQWDSPLSVVLTSTASSIEVEVPRADINGVFLTVDGSDTYAVHCVHDDGQEVQLGSVLAGVPIGMGTGLLFSEDLPSCRTILVKPERGDGYYSVGEIGFLNRSAL